MPDRKAMRVPPSRPTHRRLAQTPRCGEKPAPAGIATAPAWLARLRIRLYRFLLSLYGDGDWTDAPTRMILDERRRTVRLRLLAEALPLDRQARQRINARYGTASRPWPTLDEQAALLPADVRRCRRFGRAMPHVLLWPCVRNAITPCGLASGLTVEVRATREGRCGIRVHRSPHSAAPSHRVL